MGNGRLGEVVAHGSSTVSVFKSGKCPCLSLLAHRKISRKNPGIIFFASVSRIYNTFITSTRK